jgi:hypothetical protein
MLKGSFRMRSWFVLALVCSTSGCTIGPEPDYRPMPPAPGVSAKLGERTRELYTALSLGQVDRASLLYSQEPGRVFVGLTGNEFKTSSEQRGVAPDEFFVEPGSAIVPGELIAISDREGGWVVDRPTVRLRNGTELHIRLTLVWRNEYGIWKIVHSHASLAR